MSGMDRILRLSAHVECVGYLHSNVLWLAIGTWSMVSKQHTMDCYLLVNQQHYEKQKGCVEITLMT